MRQTIVVAIALLATCWPEPTGAIGDCPYRQWKCNEGSCIEGWWRCTGSTECPDGSDEIADFCNSMPSVRMSLGDVVTARMEFLREFDASGIFLSLCNSSRCNTLAIYGASPAGRLWYRPGMSCKAWGRDCDSWPHAVEPADKSHFTPGTLELLVERRSYDVLVWLPGHADKAVSLPVSSDSELLRIRPDMWVEDMPVEFTGAHTQSTTTEPPTSTTEVRPTAVPSTTQAPMTPSPAPTKCDPSWLYKLIPVPGHCNQFTVCYSGRSKRKTCRNPLHFSYSRQTCVWPADSDCVQGRIRQVERVGRLSDLLSTFRG